MAKLIWAVIQEGNLEATLDALRQHRIGVTQMGSSGGFLRKGNATLIIGVEDARVDEAIAVLCEHCQSDVSVQDAKQPAEDGPTSGGPTPGSQASGGSGVAFVLELCNERVAELRDESGDRPS
jgi:uncharacterized protein YaaQ